MAAIGEESVDRKGGLSRYALRLKIGFSGQYRKEGFADGVKEGDHAKAVAIARGMLAKGLAVSLVEEVTGLRRSAIESLDPAPAGERT